MRIHTAERWALLGLAKPRQVGYRLKPDADKKLKAVFDKIGANSTTESDNHVALIEWAYTAVQQQQNSKAVGDKLSESGSIDVSCNMRTSRKELIRILGREDKPVYTEQTVSYCVQWEKGKVKRQLKLISPAVCTICSILRAKMAEQPEPELLEPEAEQPADIQPLVEAPRVVVSAPAVAPVIEYKPQPKTYKATVGWIPMQRTDGAKVCPFDSTFVYVNNCQACKRDEPQKFYQCCRVFMEANQKPRHPLS